MLKESNCYIRKCKHCNGIENNSEPFDESKEFWGCTAFPNGIPEEIGYGDNDHTKPFKGDNGVLFEKESK